MSWWRYSDTEVYNLNSFSKITFTEDVSWAPQYISHTINFYKDDNISFSIEFSNSNRHKFEKAESEILALLGLSK